MPLSSLSYQYTHFHFFGFAFFASCIIMQVSYMPCNAVKNALFSIPYSDREKIVGAIAIAALASAIALAVLMIVADARANDLAGQVKDLEYEANYAKQMSIRWEELANQARTPERVKECLFQAALCREQSNFYTSLAGNLGESVNSLRDKFMSYVPWLGVTGGVFGTAAGAFALDKYKFRHYPKSDEIEIII
jgi:hypothetical protein